VIPTIDARPPAADLDAALRYDVRRALAADPKCLSPKWLYDAAGSALFQEITRLPEYYQTRTERAILARCSSEIARATGARTLIELGSGSSDKTRLLIDALREEGTLRSYFPLDVSADALGEAGQALTAAYPWLTVRSTVSDFTDNLVLPSAAGPRLVIFLGGTFGNLLPAERSAFLSVLHSRLAPGDALLLGVDLVKDTSTMVAAYMDTAGATARFNRNVLARLNRELGGDFDVDSFDHVALWNAEREWIEMRLRSRRAQTVTLHGLGDLTVRFGAGEEMRTEVSAKFRPTGLASELASCGLELTRWWTDPNQLYGPALAAPAPDAPRGGR